MNGQTDERADLLDGVAVLFRRWYVVLPVLLVTVFLTYRVNEDTSVRYAQTASLGIVSPSVITPDPQRRRQNGELRPSTTTKNSLMDSGGGSLLANLVTISLGQADVANSIDDVAPGTSFASSVVDRDGNQGQLPVLALSVDARTADGATAAMESLRQVAVDTTRAVQTDAGVPEERLATAYLLQSQSAPTEVVVARTRAAASVAIAGLVAAVVLAAIADALLRRRGRRRGTRVNHTRDVDVATVG